MTSTYGTKDSFNLYVFYLALKRHFTSDYDYFKYNGKIKANFQSFEKRRDKFFFYKLSKKKEAKNLIFANMLEDPNVWIGDLLEEKAHKNYTRWLKRINSLSYQFKTDLGQLDKTFDDNIKVVDGHHPPLLKAYIEGRVSIETLVIMDNLVHCFRYWDKKIDDTIIYPTIRDKVMNYKPFLDVDKEEMKSYIISSFV